MNKTFHLDIITPTSIESYENVSYLRLPSSDGLIGIQAQHAQAIIGLDIGEIKIIKDGSINIYATSGGFADIAKEGVQLLLETIESPDTIDSKRAEEALKRSKKRLGDHSNNLDRAQKSLNRAKNRLKIIKKMS
tara:strand:- start:1908 stop:2309 length:402 start_codon:yes stop_codon:yes gene_type:complete